MNKRFFIMLLSLVIMASAQLCSAAVLVEGLEHDEFPPDEGDECWVDRIAERYAIGMGEYWYPNGKSKYSYVAYRFIGGRSAAAYVDQALWIGNIYGAFYYENGAFYGYESPRGSSEDNLKSPPEAIYKVQDRDTIIYTNIDKSRRKEVRDSLSGVYKRMKFKDDDGREYEKFAKYVKDDSGNDGYSELYYPVCCALLTFLDRNGDLSGTDLQQ